MRIAHVNDIAHVATGLADTQRGQGFDAIVVDPPKPGGLWPVPLKALMFPVRAVQLAMLTLRLRRGRFDIIHIHYATHGVLGVLIGRPFFIHCHGTDVRFAGRRSLKGRYLAWVMQRAAGVFYATPDLEEWVTPLRSDARFVPNPIDTQRFAPGETPDQDVLIGVRLHPIKGAEIAIDAVGYLMDRRAGTRIAVVDDGPLAVDVRTRFGARLAMIPPRTHGEMPGLIQRHRVALGQFRLGILSQFELEAMACGIPLIAEFRFATAYAVAPPVRLAATAAAVAEEAVVLLADDELRTALGRASREWVVRHHAAVTVARLIDDAYVRGLDGAHGSPGWRDRNVVDQRKTTRHG